MRKGSRTSVMIVDGDAARRRLFYESMKGIGLDVLSAVNGEEAMKRVPQEQPDLILINLTEDGTGGLDFVRELRRYGLGKKIPIIAIVENDESRRTVALTAGVNELLKPKPAAGAVLDLVRKLLKSNEG
jgi:CheY-like chemotaxis protein